MKKIIPVVLVFFLFLSCNKQITETDEEETEKEDPTVYLLPDPQRIFLYRDGTTVYEAIVPVEGIFNNSFVLPANIDKNSFSVFQNGQRLFHFSLEETRVRLNLLGNEPETPGSFEILRRNPVLLVTIPDLDANTPLEVRFGIGRTGITWELILDMEAGPDNTLDCNLLASISTTSSIDRSLEYILSQRPEIILVSSHNIFLEGSDAVFNLDNILIEKNKTTFVKLDSGESTYRMVYQWDVSSSNSPGAFLYCTNPFTSSISRVRGNLNSGGLNVNTFSSLRLTPGRHFELRVGEQPQFRTFRSATTQEFSAEQFPARANLPFTHMLDFSATNNLQTRAELEISVPVTYGRVHRTQYRFITRAPDERPGDRMVWKYNLAPGATARVEFNFDADTKDNPLYSEYEYHSGGR